MSCRDLGLNPGYIIYCVVLDKFFNLSVSSQPQLKKENKLCDLLQRVALKMKCEGQFVL